MTSKRFLTLAAFVLGSSVAFAQSQPPRLPPRHPRIAPAPPVQAPADPGYAALIATCKTPPPAGRGRRRWPGRGGRGGGAPAPVPGVAGIQGHGDSRRHRRGPAVDDRLADGQQRRRDPRQRRRRAAARAERQRRGHEAGSEGQASIGVSNTITGGALSRSTKGATVRRQRGLERP